MQRMNERSLDGSSVLITGSQRGLGLALVEVLLARGARVYAGHRSPARVPDSLIRPGVTPVFVDVSHAAATELPDVDYVVNNAGINCSMRIDAPEAAKALRQELDVNVFGTLEIVGRYLPAMTAKRNGGFVNIVSDLALAPNPFCATYSASKAALRSLCLSLQDVCQEQNIYTLSVYPPAMDTRLTEGLPIPKLSTAHVAERIVEAWERGQAELFF